MSIWSSFHHYGASKQLGLDWDVWFDHDLDVGLGGDVHNTVDKYWCLESDPSSHQEPVQVAGYSTFQTHYKYSHYAVSKCPKSSD